MNHFRLLILTFLLLFSTLIASEFSDGYKALMTDKDYKKAHKIFLKLANGGNTAAQNNMGYCPVSPRYGCLNLQV